MKLFHALVGLALATVLIVPALAGNVFILVNPVGQVAPPTPPTLGAAGNTVSWTQGGAATTLDSSITVSGTITGANVVISSGFTSGDQLKFTNTATIIGVYNAASGQLALSGTDSAANYQAALRTITYSSTDSTPTNSGTDAVRTVTWSGLNTNVGSTGIATTVNVVELPMIAGLGSGTSYTQSGSPVTLSPSVTVSDFSAANLTSATVSISSTFLSGDTLAATVTGTSIVSSYNTGTGVLTLSNSDTLAHYQQVMATVVYSFSGSDVTNGGADLTRTLTWSVTDSHSNASASGNTQLLSVQQGITTKPSWVPSWATGTAVSCNYQVSQCWNGTNVVSPATYLTDTRSTTESCENTNSITTASANTPCFTASGLNVWPASTNLVWPSDNVNSPNWVTYAPSGGTSTVVYNTVTDPTGAANSASAVTVSRTTSGTIDAFIDNQITVPTSGTYTTSCWVKADSSISVGTVISMGLFDGVNAAGNQIRSITLTANWVRYSMTTQLAAGSGRQIILGLNPNGTSAQTGTLTFDVWRCQIEAGSALTPSIQTVTGPVTRPIDNIQATSTLSSLMAGTTGTYEILTLGSLNPNAATILDSNGNTFAGEALNGTFTTSLPGPLSTVTTANWLATTTVREGWSATGRTIGLNGSVIATDASAPVPAAPFYLGSTLGASNSFTGYLQKVTVAPTRVADSVIGIAAGGTNYFFSAAGSDANDCKSTSTSCSNNFATAAAGGQAGTGAKINTLSYNPNDTINLNKGDTFTGCVLLSGNGGNVQAVANAPLTVQSYGTGARPLVTSQGVQCPGEFAAKTVLSSAATVHIDAITGFIWNGVDISCDTSGNNSRGISLENDAAVGNNTLTIENVNFVQGCFSQSGNFNTQGSAIYWNVDGFSGASFGGQNNNSGAVIANVQILNIVCSSPTPTTLTGANACMDAEAYFGNQAQIVLTQGMLIYNLGGSTYSPANTQDNALNGSGIVAVGLFSNVTPQVFQYIVTHDNAGNLPTGCGGPYGIWSYRANNMIWQFQEHYHNRNDTINSCDHGGIDIDLGTSNTIVQYIYTHDNSGPGINLFFGTYSGVPWGNNTVRYSITDGDGVNQSNGMDFTGNGTTGSAFVYNNDVIMSGGNARNGNPAFSVGSCPGPGSIFANNIVVATQGSGVAQLGFVTVNCPTLTFANNAWWCTNCTAGAGPTSQYFWRWNNIIEHGSAAWQAAVPNGDANAKFAVNPLFQGAFGLNTTCYSATIAPTSNPLVNCPSQYVLQGGSSYKGAGADLTTSPFGSLNVGTQDYYGVAIPSGGGSGYSIGASQ